MRKQDNKIFKENLKKDENKLGLGRRWWFQRDNDPRHKAKVVTEGLNKAMINVLKWQSQSPDFNPIENLWRGMSILVNAKHSRKINELEAISAWKNAAKFHPLFVEPSQKLQQAFGGCNQAEKICN